MKQLFPVFTKSNNVGPGFQQSSQQSLLEQQQRQQLVMQQQQQFQTQSFQPPIYDRTTTTLFGSAGGGGGFGAQPGGFPSFGAQPAPPVIPDAPYEEPKDEEFEELIGGPDSDPITIVTETPMAISFSVNGESNIPSDGIDHQVSVAVLPFSAKISYITIPRIEPRVFLQVTIFQIWFRFWLY